jgi:hypothetical protein
MTRQTSVRILAVLLVATGLALRPHPLRGQEKSVPADDSKLLADLDSELSDVEAEDELVEEATVEEQIDADLRKSTYIDYDALETEMEQGGTTIEKVILDAVQQAEADAGEQVAAFAQAGKKKVNAKSVAKHFVADVRVVHDHVKEERKLRVSGLVPGSEQFRPWAIRPES